MRVEFSPLVPNPWKRDGRNRLPLLVTGSAIRREVAKACGIPLIPEDQLGETNHGEAEERIKGQLDGNGVVTPSKRGNGSPPLPVEIATDKATAVFKHFLEQLKVGSTDIPSSVGAIDSTWGIDPTPDNHWDYSRTQLLHKPNGKGSIEGIVEQFIMGASQGAHFQSTSGICIIGLPRCNYRQYLMVVDFGPLNPEFDWPSLANLISKNPNHAAGLSTPDLFNRFPDLVKMPPFVRVDIVSFGERDNKYIPRGGFFNSSAILELSSDPVNLPFLVAMSVGLIPQESRPYWLIK